MRASVVLLFFFFNDTATTEIYTLSLHDALPISVLERAKRILMESRDGLRAGLEDADNPKLLRGHAKIEGRQGKAFSVRINGEMVVAAQLVLDTGTRSLIPPIEGLADVDFIHSEN